MSREVKFKAYINNPIHGTGIFKVIKMDGNVISVRIPDKEDPMGSQDVPFFKPEYKLMQYTGINDYTGTEVYEGDIVLVISMVPGGVDCEGIVEYLEGQYWISDKFGANALFNEVDKLVVVGNKYES